ncbi:MAG: hypothetical protein RL410_754 [Actinomycetota bacterium]
MDFKAELRANSETDSRILGLVWAGSAAETSRFDEYSDFDFFLITVDDAAEPMRQDLSWLPQHHNIAYWARETAHGLKVVYLDGTILEFAVFTLDELSAAKVNHYAVDYDAADVTARTEAIHASGEYSSHESLDDHLAIIYTLLLIAIGRARRGEKLIAGQFVRSYAPLHIIRAVKKNFPSQAPEKRDVLDAWRRFEWEYPEIGAALNEAVAHDVEAAAWKIAEVTEDVFGKLSDVPAKGMQSLRDRFGKHS